VRYVYPDSGAAGAGLQPDDRIVKLAKEPIRSAEQFRVAVANRSLGEAVEMEIVRGGRSLPVEVTLSALPTGVLESLPQAREARQRDAPPGEPTGLVQIKIPGETNECVAWVPSDYDPEVAYGILVCLPVPGEFDRDAFEQRGKRFCRDNDLIALAPLPSRDDAWTPTEVGFVRKTIEHVVSRYTVDRTRVVVHGYQAGGAMAYLLAFRHRELVRGLAVVDVGIPSRVALPDNDPVQRLAIYMVLAKESNAWDRAQKTAEALRAMKYPVTEWVEEGTPKPLGDEGFAPLLRWVDALDRI